MLSDYSSSVYKSTQTAVEKQSWPQHGVENMMSQMEEVTKALLMSSDHCGGSDGSVGQRGGGRLQAVNGLADITIRCCALHCLFGFTFTLYVAVDMIGSYLLFRRNMRLTFKYIDKSAPCCGSLAADIVREWTVSRLEILSLRGVPREKSGQAIYRS